MKNIMYFACQIIFYFKQNKKHLSHLKAPWKDTRKGNSKDTNRDRKSVMSRCSKLFIQDR